ncbi:Cytidylate kinase domain-containing protein [Gamsiella multidivaricata]|uniref:Cytidylate kinase domain-containing protein n=1 Tax=Gamsiella multidivaricata TaxID=101098 RepID=UPI00221F1AA4|nr:Cytidylate kinase domain-containing protein [Gamsiella multidivaricata]KAI7820240.1 Cytidylate kinase domain-containing protein [Gamsiella multidivaricata]
MGNTAMLSGKAPLPATRVILDSKDVSSEIRTGNVSRHVSTVAAIGKVREAVLQKVRAIGAREDLDQVSSAAASAGGLVMDGRDIGTVVLPHADLKVFLVADSRVRAERRLQELIRNGADTSALEMKVEDVQKDLERRDELDRTRDVSPLKKAEDAMELDTSDLTIEDQVDIIVQEVDRRRTA